MSGGVSALARLGVSTDVWDDSWSEGVKRAVIKASLEVHRRKGTIGAVKRALAAFEFEGVSIVEWFRYGGPPYTFKIEVKFGTTAAPLAEMANVIAVVDGVKNARSHFGLEVVIAAPSDVPRLAMAATCGEIVYVHPKETL